MCSFRALIRDRCQLMRVLLALALAMKAVVPTGFMVSSGGDRYLTVTICSDASGMADQMRIALPAKPGGDERPLDAADKNPHCAFAGLGHAALGGADPIQLTSAIAFILLTGFASRTALPRRDLAFLRPPLRAPPAAA
ncbi:MULTISPECIES: DUF2946 family protein [unclassified Sphingomonas]|uniref:DUF2946 family protein n=1 Tax=Novosphingobium rhizosphaerae TaxID=1551649 RepID=UPI0015CDFC2E